MAIDFSFLNPFSKKFQDNVRDEKELQTELEKNSHGIGDAQYDFQQNGGLNDAYPGPTGGYNNNVINFQQTFTNKTERIAMYRAMSYYPEIAEALDMVADEAIVKDVRGDIAHLEFTKEFPKKIDTILEKEFKYITKEVLKEEDNLWTLFQKFLIEAELFTEIIPDKKAKKVIGYKVLPAFITFPIYDKQGRILGFAQLNNNNPTQAETLIPFEGNQVSYINWGKYGRDLLDVRGYLEPTVKTYNQLKNLEDSLIVYRLVRAPERRIWNIEVGRIPTAKAEQYIRKIISKYKKQVNYNTTTGAIDSSRNVQSLSEDFYFAKRDGQGTNVETLAGGTQLGEMNDVMYFLKKLYKTLKIPKGRWSEEGSKTYQSGKEMDRDELKFSFFIQRAQQRFIKFIEDVFMEHIRFKYGNEPKMAQYLKRSNFQITLTQANFFKEMKEMELSEQRLAVLATAMAFATSPEDMNQPLSREYVLRKIFIMTDEEYEYNQMLLDKERLINVKKKLADAELESGLQQIANPPIPEPGSVIAPEDLPEDTEDTSTEPTDTTDTSKPEDENYDKEIDISEKEKKHGIYIDKSKPINKKMVEYLNKHRKKSRKLID